MEEEEEEEEEDVEEEKEEEEKVGIGSVHSTMLVVAAIDAPRTASSESASKGLVEIWRSCSLSCRNKVRTTKPCPRMPAYQHTWCRASAPR